MLTDRLEELPLLSQVAKESTRLLAQVTCNPGSRTSSSTLAPWQVISSPMQTRDLSCQVELGKAYRLRRRGRVWLKTKQAITRFVIQRAQVILRISSQTRVKAEELRYSLTQG